MLLGWVELSNSLLKGPEDTKTQSLLIAHPVIKHIGRKIYIYIYEWMRPGQEFLYNFLP